jgi:hypothetical protein
MKTNIKQAIAAFIILIGALFILDFVGTSYYGEHTVTGKVLDKEKVVKNQDSYYLIYTDNETFTIQDSLIKGQWRSSDIYGHIEKGQTYKLSVFGWRSGFFSMYRNIVKAEIV